MKILFYADLHFRENGSFIPWNKPQENGLTGELNNTIRGCLFVAQMVKSLTPDLCCNLGDVFHPLENISVRTLHGAHLGLSAITSACREVGVKHYLVCGNHDIYSEETKICSTSILTGYFDEIFSNVNVLAENIGIVPFHSDPKDIYEELMEFAGSHDLIITHNDFKGAKYENGFETDSNISPDLPTMVISGHIHAPQTVGSVTYVGSLIQHRFSQYNLNDNGVLLYDTSTRRIKRFRNNLSKHYVVVKDLEQAKRFEPDKVILKVLSDQPKEEVEKVLEEYEYAYFPIVEEKDFGKEVVANFQIEDPLSVLKNYIIEDNPDALEVFEKAIKKRRLK